MDPAVVRTLLKQIEAKDQSTAAHTWRVVLYTRAMLERHGLDHETIRRASLAAALHDVGKLDIPNAILQKPGPLTPEEFAVIKTHPVTGFDRLVALGEDDEIVLRMVRWHHEHVDGSGYPDGLKAEAIPVGPRYFTVIDSFDALTSVRPYRREVGPAAAEQALEELHAGIGTRYCAEAVEVFSALYREGQLGWILNYFNDSCPLPDYGHEAVEKAAKERRGR